LAFSIEEIKKLPTDLQERMGYGLSKVSICFRKILDLMLILL
jgi:hypothetical protein